MLVITRRVGETFYIGDNVQVTIADISGDKVKVSISAPKEITILRKELVDAQNLNKESLQSASLPIASLKSGFKKLTDKK